MRTYQILGVKFHAVSMDEALKIMEAYLLEDKPRLVVTVGPEMIMRAQHDEEFKSIVNGADLVVADGSGVLWAAARCGVKVPERVAGVELIDKFAEILAARPEKAGLYFLGAAPGVAEKAAEKMKAKYSGLPVAGIHDGFFKDDGAMASAIRESGAQVVYAALGSPKQEKFIRDYGQKAGLKIGVGVGGSFDVISGLKKRAPKLFIKLRLEWLYRILSEPSRWRRALAIPNFMQQVIKQGRGAVTEWKEES
ncbi:MAG: WecB/TagA/CpsF family glycosyltransferase [Candidatus Bruticola sp.]